MTDQAITFKASVPRFWQLKKIELVLFLASILCVLPALHLAPSIEGFALLLPLFVFFIYKPEAALAFFFNGTIVYFYLLFKLDRQTSSLSTAIFYAFLLLPVIINRLLALSKGRPSFKIGRADGIFFLFLGLILVSYAVMGTGNESALKKLSFLPLFVVVPYLGIRTLNTTVRVKCFLNYTVLVTALLILPAYYELLFNPFFAGVARFSMYRLDSGITGESTNNPILFGMTFAVLALILIIWMMETKRAYFANLSSIAPSVYLIFASGSRGAMLSFLLALVFYLTIINKFSLRKILAVLFFSGLIFSVYKLLPETSLELLEYSVSQGARVEDGSSIAIRNALWKSALDDFLEHPVAGVGFGNSVGGTGHPHNLILEVAAEYGFLGLLLLIAFIYVVALRVSAISALHVADEAGILFRIALTACFYAFVEAMFSGYLTQQSYLFILIALILSIADIITGKEKQLRSGAG